MEMGPTLAHIRKLRQALPWLQLPIICNAPMSSVATSELAIAVTRSGGLGYIGFTGNPQSLERELDTARRQLIDIMIRGSSSEDINKKLLPIGVGIIVFDVPVQPWLQTFSKYKPAVVWLSFGKVADFQQWVFGIHAVSPGTKIWIQVGSVAAALEAALACHPDALVLQGIDAGGHGHQYGASVISLVPEVMDALRGNGLGDIPLVAAGGIMDGRGTAAALHLGASAIVMGTRFLGAEEARLDLDIREKIFSTFDGGESTVRSRVFDDIWGLNPWPELYDGRCIRNALYDYLQEGLTVADIRKKYSEPSHSVEAPVMDTATVWAGSGIGMVKKMEPAADIVKNVQSETRANLAETMSIFES